MPGMACWFVMFSNAFCNITMHITRCTLNRSVPLILSLNHLIVTLGLAFANYLLYLREKKISMDLLRYEKKHSFLVDLSKFLKIMHRYACFVFVFFFFRNYAKYGLDAKLCYFTSVHINSGSLEIHPESNYSNISCITILKLSRNAILVLNTRYNPKRNLYNTTTDFISRFPCPGPSCSRHG